MTDESDFPMEMNPTQTQEVRLDDSACMLLDVRESEEYSYCSIADSLHVPLGLLHESLPAIDPELPVAVYCHHGVRSLSAVRILRGKGFAKAFSIKGGIDRWSLEIDPSLPRY